MLLFSWIFARSFSREQLGLHQVDHAQTGARGLVAVGRTDAALGRADFALALAQLALFVERAVIRQDEVRAVADEQVSADRDPDFAQAVDFPTSATGSMTTPLPITQILPRRRMPEGMRCRTYFLPPMNDGVAGVIAALAADDDVGVAGQDIDDLAFSFIAPLRADQNRICHALQPVESESPAPFLKVAGHCARTIGCEPVGASWF